MEKRKNISFYYIIFIIVILLLNLFVLKISEKILLLPLFMVFLIIALLIFKYRKDNFYMKNSLMIFMPVFGICQIALYYLTGLLEGFSNNAVKINFERVFEIIIPLIIILVITELLRYLISNKFSESKLMRFFAIVMFVLIDITLFASLSNLGKLDNLIKFAGIILFPSIVSNVVFDKLVLKYGYKPIVLYRVLTSLCYYMIPIVPNTFVLFRSIGRITLPLVMYLTISYMYDKMEFQEVVVKKKASTFVIVITIILFALMSALISCKFKYGILTVGSGSMTGTLNIGDAILYESYSNQKIDIGDVIIYRREKRSIIHRVIEIGVFNGDYVYVTKGDKNKLRDPGYVYKVNIQGIVKKRIKYLGYPSIWIRNIFR